MLGNKRSLPKNRQLLLVYTCSTQKIIISQKMAYINVYQRHSITAMLEASSIIGAGVAHIHTLISCSQTMKQGLF